MDGILLSYLKALDIPADWTVRRFKEEYILPKTNNGQYTYAEMLAKSENAKEFHRAKADVFISYAWDLKFRDVIQALPIDNDNEVNHDRFVWMDVFCSKQSPKPNEDDVDVKARENDEHFFDQFRQVLKEIGRAELVILPWKDPLPPKRSWCVFEYSVIVSEEVDFVCRMTKSDRDDFKSHIKKNKTSSAFYSNIFGTINVLGAKAERKSDQEKIMQIIMQVGRSQVNDAVMKGLKHWLDDVMQDSLSEVQGKGTEEEANVLCAQGFFANVLGNFQQAQISFENSLQIHKKLAKGGQNENIPALKSNLALVLARQGNYTEAEPLLRESLAFYLGEDQTLSSRNQVATASTNLGNVLRKLNKLEEAESLYNSALSIYRDLAESPNTPTRASISIRDNSQLQTAVCLNNLGRLYQKKAQHEKACKLFTQAYEIDLQHYGPDHPEVATDLHNEARSLKELGMRDEAIEKGQRALEIFTRVYGADHPNTIDVARAWLNRVSSKHTKPPVI